MTTIAEELRAMATDIEEAARKNRSFHTVLPAIQALCDYLTLRALVSELQNKEFTECQPTPKNSKKRSNSKHSRQVSK